MKYYDCITEFIFKEDQPQYADAIFVPGSPYGEIAENAAALYRQGFAPLVIPSGKYSKLIGHFPGAVTPEEYRQKTYETESDFLTAVLLANGVKQEDILQERRATFTYENAIYTWQLLQERQIKVKKAIISCQAYHARRALMYYQLLFPETEFLVCPVKTRGLGREDWYEDKEKMLVVLKEVEHCGSQFALVLGRDGQMVDSGDFSCYPNGVDKE